jgi:hypothetical protein
VETPYEIRLYVILRLEFNELVYKIEANPGNECCEPSMSGIPPQAQGAVVMCGVEN